MSEINPGNYDGVNVTIVGRAGGPAQFPAYDKEGAKGVLELNVAVSQGYKKGDDWVDTGTTWYTYTAAGDYANVLREVGKGDKVRIDNARLETREFKRKDESVGQQFTVRFGELTIIEAKGNGGAPAAAATTADVWNTPAGGFADETPF